MGLKVITNTYQTYNIKSILLPPVQQQIVIINQLINNAYIYGDINCDFKYEKHFNR